MGSPNVHAPLRRIGGARCSGRHPTPEPPDFGLASAWRLRLGRHARPMMRTVAKIAGKIGAGSTELWVASTDSKATPLLPCFGRRGHRTWPPHTPSRPTILTQIRSKSAKFEQIRSGIDHIWSEMGRHMTRLGPASTKLGPKSINFGPKSIQVGMASAEIGPTSTDVGPSIRQNTQLHRLRPKLVCPKLTTFGQETAKFGPKSTKSGPSSTNSGPLGMVALTSSYTPEPAMPQRANVN